MITIVADTLSSIPPDEAIKLGIPYVPQIIIFGNDSYKDDYEMDAATFIQRLRSSPELPKTAAPPPALYAPIYEKYATDGNTVIVLAPSSDVSGTFRGATVGAEDFPGADIRIIDTRTLGSGLGTIVLKAREWVNQGLDADTVATKVKEMSARQRVYLVVDTLEYLHKGGRIGGAKMLMGSLLQVKPILQLSDGHIEPVENQRTKRHAISRLKELVQAEFPHNDNGYLTLMHGDALIEAEALADEFVAAGFSRPKIFDLPPAILVHAGPGVVAVSFFA